MFEYMKSIWDQGFPCVFHLMTGWYCPGCGGTRAVKALLRGNLIESFHYHPVVLYTVLACAVLGAGWFLASVFKNPKFIIKRYEWVIFFGVGLVLVNWLVKNYFLIAKGIDLLVFDLRG